MNDFTKEELVLLKLLAENRGTMTLINKIQSLIDNYTDDEYCEHSGVKLDTPTDPKVKVYGKVFIKNEGIR